MPNEPCGNDVCVDKAELDGLRFGLAATEQQRDDAVAACAGMREALEAAAKQAGCKNCGAEEFCDSRNHNPSCPSVVVEKMIQAALAPTIGADTLKRIKDMEGLLRDIQSDYELCSSCGPDCGEYEDCTTLQRYRTIDTFLKGDGKDA